MPAPNSESIAVLKSNVRGEVLLPDSPGYDAARTIWNAMIDKRPAVIVRCTGVADVIAAVNFGRDQGLVIAVRGGGHNIAGNAVCNDGLMIDLSRMKSVHVNPATQRAYAGPGATLGDFDHETAVHGLATPTGINSTTGIAGLTLGGGFGWLSRSFGLTADNVISMEVVTAEGKRVCANADENSDLFWALRGGGGNFGIVTQFEYQLHAVGPNVLAGLIVFPGADTKAILAKYRDFAATMPDELTIWVVTRGAPPLPFLPAEVHGKHVIVLAFCYAGDPAQGEKLIAPLRNFGKAHGELVGVMPFAKWQQAFDPLLTPGARNYWKSHNFTELKDGLFDVTVEYAEKLPSPHCEIFIAQLGGATLRVASDAMAYGNRDARFVMNVHGRWETAAEDAKCIDWSRKFFDAAAPFATGGVYVNFMTEEETNRVANAFGPNHRRLAEIKAKYDPKNLFRLNQNIKPA